MAKKKLKLDPQTLLDDVIGLIAQDIEHIRAAASQGKLEYGPAMDLTRYASTLKSVVDARRRADEDEDDKLASMSTQELKVLAAQLLKESD